MKTAKFKKYTFITGEDHKIFPGNSEFSGFSVIEKSDKSDEYGIMILTEDLFDEDSMKFYPRGIQNQVNVLQSQINEDGLFYLHITEDLHHNLRIKCVPKSAHWNFVFRVDWVEEVVELLYDLIPRIEFK